MLVARWADDIRTQAKLQRETKWHYINFPFTPAGEPEDIKPCHQTRTIFSRPWRRTGELSKARYQRINGQSRWRGYSTSLATSISRYIRYSCSPENIRTAIVAAMKCAFGWHQSEHRSTFIGFGWTDYVNQQRRPVEKYCDGIAE